MKGKCGLCYQEAELKDSHLIPKSLYKRIRSSSESNDIILFRSDEASAHYTSSQIKRHFLCGSCEHLFSVKGENRVNRECYDGKDSFEFRDRVLLKGQPLNIYKVTKAAENFENWCEYFYFAVSIIWRASNWPDKNFPSQIVLGTSYEEDIREYLKNEAGIPDNIFLCIYVDSDNKPSSLIHFPVTAKKDGFHIHSFYIPGMKFSLFIGKKARGKIPFEKDDSRCLAFLREFKSHPDFSTLSNRVANNYNPKGRLADDLKKKKGN